MNRHEQIVRNAFDAARVQGVSFGDGGKAMATLYKDHDGINADTLLGMIAIMANGLVDADVVNS